MNAIKNKRLACTVSGFVLALSCIHVGHAQTVETLPPVSDALDEIIVTAQRVRQNLQTVPVSVTALSADMLLERGLNDQTQITLTAPSLQLGKENNFTVRGIGTLAFASTIDNSVAQAIDEVNIGRPQAAPPLLYDVAQVEVLNGPQGLLFGKNASAGLVNIGTVNPVLGETSGSVDVEGVTRSRPGSDGRGLLVRAALNVPVTADSALRIAAVHSRQDALTQHVGGKGTPYEDDLRQSGARIKYDYMPDNGFSLRLQGDYNESHGISGFHDTTFRILGAGSVNLAPLAADNVVASTDNLIAAADAPAYRDLRNGGAQAILGYEFDNGWSINNITAWRFYKLDQQIDGDSTGQDGANRNKGTGDYDQYSTELRVVLPAAERLSGQAGLYYFHSTMDRTLEIGGNNFFPAAVRSGFPFCVGATVTVGGPPNCSVSNDYFLGVDKAIGMTTDSYAAFGQLTYAVTDQFKVIGGARLTRDELSIDLKTNQLYTYFAPLASKQIYSQSQDNNDFSYKAGIQYEFTPAIMAYGTYARGYKGPGFNDVGTSANTDLVILPETSKSFEAGLKSTWFDRRLMVNITGFHTKFSNYQTQSFDPNVRTFVVANGASLTSKGVELTVTAKPVHGLTIGNSSTLLSAKFDDFPGAQCYPGQTTPSCAVNNSFNAGGLRSPSSPKFTSTTNIAYETPISDSLAGFVGADWYHRSAINYLINQAPGARVGAIDLLGANIGVKGDNWRAALFCKNCTNKIYPTYIDLEAGDSIAGVASYTQGFGYNSVRTVGIQLGYSF